MTPPQSARSNDTENCLLYFSAMREFRSTVPRLCAPPEPYSYSVRAGRTIYLAGQVALDEHMQIVGSTLAEQARQVWHNIEAVLAASGAALADVVKINYFLQDIRELPEEIEVRKELFAADKMPAVTAVQAAALGLPGLKMEVDIIAVLSDA
jgi:2-iminobutanoate/2-iminopropanoate deaminase